jgi:hypothetical protein
MAKEPASIPREPKVPDSQNYSLLKADGVDRLQALAGEIWTDYNQHDPGITILEQLCYAITEMAYKSGMSMDDLLYAKRQVAFDPKDNAFYAADKVFPCSPLTQIDYRRLLVDHLYPTVKNAWLVPMESGAFGVNMSGLFQVSLILSDNSEDARQKAREDAYRLLNRHRNLCEDFDQVRILLPLQLSVKADIAIDPKAHAEQVIGTICYALANAFTPAVRFDTMDELLEMGINPEQIFDGPPPMHGFVNIQSLKASGIEPQWSVIHPTRLVNMIREIKGVERVSQLEVGIQINGKLPEGFKLIEKLKGDEEFDGYYLTTSDKKLPRGHKVKPIKNAKKDLVAGLYIVREEDSVPDGYFPQLDVENMIANRTITCTIEGLSYEYDGDSVQKSYQRLVSEQLTQYQHELEFPERKGSSRRSVEELAFYASIQNSFPEIYGIGDYGVSKSRPLEWRKHAKHLKAYLFFFEQIMADYLAQLTNFYQLFSLKEQLPATYFHQVPQVPNQSWLLKPGQTVEDLQAALERIGTSFDPMANRRNRALDHLLARFGEEFLSDAYNAITRNAIEENQQKFENELIKAKLRFLENIVELGRDRGRGLDYLSYAGGQEATDFVTHNTALQKRLALLFNMKDHQHISLADAIRDAEGVHFGKKGKTKGEPKTGAAFTFGAKQKDILQAVMKEGLSRDSFTIEENPKKKGEYQVFFNGISGKGAKDPVFSASSVERSEAAITALMRRLRELNASAEGFHLVEHVLLRPVGSVMFTWYLVREGRIFLETPVMEHVAFEDEFKQLLKSRATDPENYITTGTPDEGFTLVLTGEDGSVIAYKEGYIDETSAERERDRIVLLISQIDDPDSGLVIRKEQHIPKGALLADDFYSLQLSVVLPTWPVRFRNDKFRALFEQVVKLNVAAHTHVVCYWVDLAEMADFEKIYLEWRTEKAKLQPKQPWLDELSWCLVILLKFFADPHDPLVLKELPGLRDKHGLSMMFGDEGA